MTEQHEACKSCSSKGTDGCNPEKCSTITKLEVNKYSSIKKVIAVMSGKGGVGKSTVTSLIASSLAKQGARVGILDADLTGPSIPKLFGINSERAKSSSEGLIPVKTKLGIKVMSVNLLLEDNDDPVIWRGPVLAGVVKQFWQDVLWEDLDYLVLDLPPGTGDVPLTVMQSIPINGIIMVTSPQDLVNHIVSKAIRMAEMLNTEIIALVENMSYAICSHCNEPLPIFGESKADITAEKYQLPVMAKLPWDENLTKLADQGEIEEYEIKLNLDMIK